METCSRELSVTVRRFSWTRADSLIKNHMDQRLCRPPADDSWSLSHSSFLFTADEPNSSSLQLYTFMSWQFHCSRKPESNLHLLHLRRDGASVLAALPACRGICGSRRAERQYELEIRMKSCVLFWNELKPAATVLICVSLPPPLWLKVWGWWRGKWWPFTPLSWSLTAHRMNLCLMVRGQTPIPAVALFSPWTHKVR